MLRFSETIVSDVARSGIDGIVLFNRYLHNNEILLECTILKEEGVACERYNNSLFKASCICKKIEQSGRKMIINKIPKNNNYINPSFSHISQQSQPFDHFQMNGLYMQHNHPSANGHINIAGNGAVYGGGIQGI